MNLLVDESVNKLVVNELRDQGHNVIYIAEFAPSVDDETVLDHANRTRSLLLTEDKDFGELVFRQGLIHMGVVLIRLSGLSPQTKVKVISAVFENYSIDLINSFSVISPGRIRIRKIL